MVQHRRFMDLALDEDGLHTPDGVIAMSALTRADIIRNRARDDGEGGSETSGAGVVGGALLGGAVAGPLGAVGGGLLGSAVGRGGSDEPFPRTVSATLVFESPDLAYSETVPAERVQEAAEFVAAVKRVAGL